MNQGKLWYTWRTTVNQGDPASTWCPSCLSLHRDWVFMPNWTCQWLRNFLVCGILYKVWLGKLSEAYLAINQLPLGLACAHCRHCDQTKYLNSSISPRFRLLDQIYSVRKSPYPLVHYPSSLLWSVKSHIKLCKLCICMTIVQGLFFSIRSLLSFWTSWLCCSRKKQAKKSNTILT